MPYCANCGSQELSDQKFCTVCGTRSMSDTDVATQLPYFPMDGPADVKPPGLAHFWWRVLSFSIDSLILGLIVAVPLRSSHQTFYLIVVAQAAAAFLYGALFIGFANGQTLGMRAVRIRCVRAVDRGRVEPRRAFRRAFLYTALLLIGTLYHFQAIVNPDHHQTIENGKHAAIVLLLALPHYADLLWVSWDKKNQTLHDKFAQTIVIREPKVAS